jgi:hypothetical protein
VRTTEHIAKSASTPKAGLFVLLRGALNGDGTGAPKIARRTPMTLAFLGTIATVMALTAAPALAATPTIVSESVSNIKATEATFEGVVNPNGQVTECHFQYGVLFVEESEVSCTPELLNGSSAQSVGPTKLVIKEGNIETVPAPITGLTSGKTYTYRIITMNGKGEEATGPENKFNTAEEPEKEKATGITATTAKLNGVLNPHHEFEAGTYEFAYRQSASECQRIKPKTGQPENEKATPATASLGATPEPREAKVTGLQPGAVYTFCLLARNAAGEEAALSAPETFTTLPAAPTLSAEASTNLTATSAELTAQINPNDAETTYHFEYGTTTAYGTSVPVPDANIGAGTPAIPAAIPVSQKIEGLTPGTVYDWRLIASNAAGTSTSVNHTFIYSTATAELPDNRAYELVTPVQKNGASVGDIFEGPKPDVSAAGSRVIAMSIQCFAASESCTANRKNNGEPFEFTRAGEGRQCEPLPPPCWATTALAPLASTFSENTPYTFSADEGTALFSMPTGTGPAHEDEFYARNPGGSFLRIGPANPPGRSGVLGTGIELHATADLSHLVWDQKQAEKELWPFDKTENGFSLYEYVGAANPQPFLVGVSGGYEEGKNHNLISTCGTQLGTESTWNALSADGRTVFFTANQREEPGCFGSGAANKLAEVPVGELYARVDGEESGAHTVAISQPDAPETLASTPADKNCTSGECQKDITEKENWRTAGFEGGSEDGSKVFFLDPQQLTDGATQGAGNGIQCDSSENHCNLYLYDFGRPAGENLIDVSAGDTSGLGPRVQGVLATSADGSHVYFLANGVLASGATPGNCNFGSEQGRCNLYVYERDARYPAGHTAFIASLFPVDARALLERAQRQANVTPDGRFLVFRSTADLTPDDVRGPGYNQIFRYDAQTEQLVRISIGERGFNDNGNAGTGDATIVPALEAERHAGPPRGDPTMSNDGSYVFFQSPVALTPHSLNDVVAGHFNAEPEYAQNVYEWHAGHVYLISDGHDVSTSKLPCSEKRIGEPASQVEVFESATCLLGADATGSNVFFTTSDRLVPQDTDTQVDIYDARICDPEHGNPCIQPAPKELPPCGGEACHGIPPQRSSLLTGGSATFNGALNPTPPPLPKAKTAAQLRAEKLAKALSSCRKKYKKQKRRRAACERQAHKAYGAKKAAKRATTNRRPG